MMKRGPAVRSALLPLFLLLLPLLHGCATIPYDYPRTPSAALYLPEATSMGKKIQAQVAEHQGASGFYLLIACSPPKGTSKVLTILSASTIL
jgi:hypothetical protein